MLLEVCAFNLQSAVIAEKVGAKRVELCENPADGGTTPSYGTIKQTREKIGISLYPIVRPRAGNYFFDEDEFAIIKQDILLCKELGCDGISTGVSKGNGEIDTERLKRMVEWAYPMGVTCHRVFDATPDPMKALEDIITCGCERVLTSGQKPSAPEGINLLAELVQQADGRIIIMPGAGVRSGNIETLVNGTGATEFHTSARMIAPDPVTFRNPAILDATDWYIANEEELRKIMEVLNNISL
ncbi:copper homeostasis protein CutC [Niastella koreensis]|uniref:PF03932 family protein CutC n=2 Tax=Niastella koreensis TaxID=354356 RepID=G8T9P6_NIAKG|nr:copper homeostasis protein CutC [Niastella koreensis]AEW00239.1 CutC family protein [Niastella koreensis GR20-10]OQP49464.1 copper homeostasis protein CutC [Niastella koreensis]